MLAHLRLDVPVGLLAQAVLVEQRSDRRKLAVRVLEARVDSTVAGRRVEVAAVDLRHGRLAGLELHLRLALLPAEELCDVRGVVAPSAVSGHDVALRVVVDPRLVPDRVHLHSMVAPVHPLIGHKCFAKSVRFIKVAHSSCPVYAPLYSQALPPFALRQMGHRA